MTATTAATTLGAAAKAALAKAKSVEDLKAAEQELRAARLAQAKGEREDRYAAIQADFQAGMDSIGELAAKHEVRPGTVRRALRAADLIGEREPRDEQAVAARDEQILERYDDGESVADVAAALECSRGTVRRVLKREGRELRGDTAVGPRVELSDEHVAALSAIADAYGTSVLAVARAHRAHTDPAWAEHRREMRAARRAAKKQDESAE